MYHLLHRVSVLAFLLLPVWANAQTRKQITLEDIWQNGTFAAKDVPGFNALKNGTQYGQLDQSGNDQQINIYNLSNGKKLKTIFSNDIKSDIGAISGYELSNDEQKILLFTKPASIYRRSILYKVWVYDIQTGKKKVLDNEAVLHATFNPQGTQVAFVKDNNIYISDLKTGNKTTVTSDGETNKIINGNCDWVYEEEWEFTRAFEWSPDGNALAYYRFDESNVKEYTIPFYEDGNYPRLYTYKYPKAGEDNSIVTIHFYNVKNTNTVKADIGTETNQYIPRIKWTNDPGKLCIYRMNRLQNKLELLLTDAQTGNSDVVYEETNKYYIEINDNLSFLPDGKSFVFTSEKDGFNHLYKWNWVDKKLTQLTKGNWEVDKIKGIDKKNACVYYTAGVISPLERKLYKVDLAGKSSVCLTNENGTHDITPCEGYQFFLDKYSKLNSVPVYTLINNQGEKVRVLEDNAALKATMEKYDLSVITTLQIPNGKGDMLNAWIMRYKSSPSRFS
jgi:dipeptidyl-peptidase-4